MKIHPMTVTSPHTRGPEVTRRQRLLKHNWTGIDFMKGGAVDGDFGPETGRACIRAKYWLGYLRKDMTATYGPYLDAYLKDKSKLPAANAKRRKRRAVEQAREPLRAKALARAQRDVGMKERPPNSNWSVISRRWGVQGPWCAMGVSEWYIDSGSKAFIEHHDYAYVPFMLAAAEHGGHGLALVRFNQAKPGDIVCFDWDHDGVADHTGLFSHHLGITTFATVEANTAVGNDSNGGEVMRRDREVGQLARWNGAPTVIRVGR